MTATRHYARIASYKKSLAALDKAIKAIDKTLKEVKWATSHELSHSMARL